MSFLKEILETNDLVNARYRESKIPRFIQSFIIKHYKRKLIKIINKMNPEYMPADAIYDFALAVISKYPEGKYDNIKVNYIDNSSSIMFSIEVPIVMDNIIDATIYIDIMKQKDDNYYLKIKVKSWTNSAPNSMYDTSFTRYQALSLEACNEFFNAGFYTEFRVNIFKAMLNELYNTMKKFLLDEVNTKGLLL